MSVYNSFTDRCNYAARCIREARDTSNNRQFDTCFEMNDGDAVAVNLYRRYLRNPDAFPIWKYLNKDVTLAAVARAKKEAAQ